MKPKRQTTPQFVPGQLYAGYFSDSLLMLVISTSDPRRGEPRQLSPRTHTMSSPEGRSTSTDLSIRRNFCSAWIAVGERKESAR